MAHEYIGRTFWVGGETYIIIEHLPKFGAFRVHARKTSEVIFMRKYYLNTLLEENSITKRVYEGDKNYV